MQSPGNKAILALVTVHRVHASLNSQGLQAVSSHAVLPFWHGSAPHCFPALLGIFEICSGCVLLNPFPGALTTNSPEKHLIDRE